MFLMLAKTDVGLWYAVTHSQQHGCHEFRHSELHLVFSFSEAVYERCSAYSTHTDVSVRWQMKCDHGTGHACNSYSDRHTESNFITWQHKDTDGTDSAWVLDKQTATLLSRTSVQNSSRLDWSRWVDTPAMKVDNRIINFCITAKLHIIHRCWGAHYMRLYGRWTQWSNYSSFSYIIKSQIQYMQHNRLLN